MQTEMNQAMTQLCRDVLSQDTDIVIFRYRADNGRGESEVVEYAQGTEARFVCTVSLSTAQVFVEIVARYWRADPEGENGEARVSTTQLIPLEDVYDVEVNRCREDGDYSKPYIPYARWLRNAKGILFRLDLT